MPQGQRQIVSVISGIGTTFAIGYVGYLVFPDPKLGVVAGVLSSVGSYFVFDYVVAENLADDGAAHPGGESGTVDRPSTGGLHAGALGFALDASGVVAFALGFVFEDGS